MTMALIKTTTGSLCLLLPLLGSGADWRLSLDQQLIGQRAGDGNIPLQQDDSLSTATTLSAQLSQQGVFVKVRAEHNDEAWTASVPEAFYDASAGPLELSIGRKSLPWDYGFFAAPLNWLGPTTQEQKDDARPLVLAEVYSGLQVWQAACAPEYNDDNALCVARTEGFSRLFDWQLLAGYDGAPRLGAGLYWLAHDALAVRFSGAWIADAPTLEWRPETPLNGHLTATPLQSMQSDRYEMLLGLSWTSSSNTDVLLEHHWNSNALSREDWQAIARQRQRLDDQPEPVAGLRAANLGWLAHAASLDPLVEHRTLLRVAQTWNDWTWRATGLGFWTDEWPTWITELGADYQWNPVATVSTSWRYHDNEGVLADLGHEFKVTLNVQTGG